MRLYVMYYICKQYIDEIKNMKLDSRTANGKEIRSISNWKKRSIILNELGNISPIRDKVKGLYDTIPVFYRDYDKFDLSETTANSFVKARNNLIAGMETIIKLYESVNPNKYDNVQGGIDVKLPQFKNLNEFSECLKDLNFVVTQCPYLLSKDEEIKFGAVDVGSIWLTLAVVGASGAILFNFGKIVDQAVKIKSHMTTVKMQEETLRSMEIKNEIAETVLNAFKQTKDSLFQQNLDALKNEIGELKDGEEVDKVKKTLEKLGYWMDKGMQIYSSIDTPPEIKDAFPAQQEYSFLTDDLQKLIEEKKDKE